LESSTAREFVIDIGVALHRFGTPADRLESALGGLSTRLGLEAHVFTTPTQLMVGFGPPGDQHAVMLRVQPGEIDLDKLAALDALADAVVAGEIGVEEGLRRVREIASARKRYGALPMVLAFTVTSAAVARFFGGGPHEMGTAAVIGLATGLLALVFSRTVTGSHLFELVAAFVAAVVAIGATQIGLPASFQVATLAGLIILIPGLTLTVAVTELATRNLVSGTARSTAAAIVFMEIAFGVALGEQVMTRAFGAAVVAHGPLLPPWTEPIALVAASLSIAVLFQAHPRSIPVVVLSCCVAFYGSRLGAWLLGPALGACVGAFGVAAFSNLYARTTRRPAMVPMVPGTLLLVPGSIGFRSLTSMVDRDVITGIDTAFTMVLVAVSLVAGLLIANATISPRRNL